MANFFNARNSLNKVVRERNIEKIARKIGKFRKKNSAFLMAFFSFDGYA